MEEIKIGEYIRTKHDYIVKVVNINEWREPSMKYGVEANYLKDIMFIGDNEILKHSFNIINLLEDKDIVILEYYVSKYRKRIQRKFEIEVFGKDIYFLNYRCSFLYNKEQQKFINGKGFNPKIKAIATKECFSRIEYKLEEK